MLQDRRGDVRLTINTSLLAYATEEAILDRANASENGIKIKIADHSKRLDMRNRLNYCRQLHRRENMKIYEPADFMHGKSHYDELVIKVVEDGVSIVKAVPIDSFDIEEL
jgi:hypothetical protein